MPDPITLLDLTSLGSDDTAATIDALCVRALVPAPPVAAVCVLPAFVSVAAEALDTLLDELLSRRAAGPGDGRTGSPG